MIEILTGNLKHGKFMVRMIMISGLFWTAKLTVKILTINIVSTALNATRMTVSFSTSNTYRKIHGIAQVANTHLVLHALKCLARF